MISLWWWSQPFSCRYIGGSPYVVFFLFDECGSQYVTSPVSTTEDPDTLMNRTSQTVPWGISWAHTSWARPVLMQAGQLQSRLGALDCNIESRSRSKLGNNWTGPTLEVWVKYQIGFNLCIDIYSNMPRLTPRLNTSRKRERKWKKGKVEKSNSWFPMCVCYEVKNF